MNPVLYRMLADAVLVMHVAFVAFVVLGLCLVIVGGVRGWRWVRNRRFRLLHLAAIGVVVLQSWLGMVCPLTDVEMTLRRRAGEVTYAGSFIEHWLHELLYFEASAWVFTVCYTLFGLAVALSWMKFPPHLKS